MSRADLLARIRKCMALAASANEHEAAASLATVRRLMAEYGVDEAEVALAEVGESEARGGGCQKPPRWEDMLVNSVMRAIPVQAIFTEVGVLFVGLSPAPEVANYAFTALYRQCKRARADYIRSHLSRCKLARKRSRADAFCEGWARSVYRAIVAIAPEEPLAPVIRRYLAERHANLATVETRSGASDKVGWNDRARGAVEGSDVRLARGVAGTVQLRLGQGV